MNKLDQRRFMPESETSTIKQASETRLMRGLATVGVVVAVGVFLPAGSVLRRLHAREAGVAVMRWLDRRRDACDLDATGVRGEIDRE